MQVERVLVHVLVGAVYLVINLVNLSLHYIYLLFSIVRKCLQKSHGLRCHLRARLRILGKRVE